LKKEIICDICKKPIYTDELAIVIMLPSGDIFGYHAECLIKEKNKKD